MKLFGIVRSDRRNVGSKSEHVGYRIMRSDGTSLKLYRAGDNPFSNRSLAPYDGCKVEVIGDLDGELLIVKEIRTLDSLP